MEIQSTSASGQRKRKKQSRYERFGEVLRYLTLEELRLFFDGIDTYRHKLMFQVIYELGCRVGEFVRIQLKHLSFTRSTVFFPAANTKTRHARTSYLPQGLMNELKSQLRQQGMVSKRSDQILKPEAYLFHPGHRWQQPYTETLIRQIFQYYIEKSQLQQIYSQDRRGRNLKMVTVHSLRHSHIMHYILDKGLPLPFVQRQVGHRSLKTTSVYLAPSSEKIARAYQAARQ